MKRPGPAASALAVAIIAANLVYAVVLPAVLDRFHPTHPYGYHDTDSPTGDIAAKFVDVTSASHIDYRRAAWGRSPAYPAVLHGGLATADVDGNGFLDLYFPPGGPDLSARLYLNQGGWSFTDNTADAGLEATGFGAGAAFADPDNDGDADLYVLLDDDGRYYENDGAGRFTDRTATAGLSLLGLCGEARCTPSSLVWTDADRDGDLDLFLVNNLDWRDPELHSSGVDYTSLVAFGRPQRTVLFENLGNATFRDATLDAGAWDVAKGLGATAADLDGDGWTELLTANDISPNAAFQRGAEGPYRNVAPRLRINEEKSSMGLQAADVTGDGRPDLVISNLRTDYLSLLVQRADGSFHYETKSRGLGATGRVTGWGVALFDADLDGWLDIAHAAGRPAPLGPHDSDVQHELFPQTTRDVEDQLFRNTGEGSFVEATASAGAFGDGSITRGLLAVDLDNDGDLDVVRVNLDAAPAQVLRNDLSSGGASITLDLNGTRSNRDGFGARIEARLPSGRTVTVEAVSAGGYQTGFSPRVTLGLGEFRQADVTVRWPSGALQTLAALPAGFHAITEPLSSVDG